MPSRLQKDPRCAGRRVLGGAHATTEAAIWTIGEAAAAKSAKAARTKVADNRIEGRVVVI